MIRQVLSIVSVSVLARNVPPSAYGLVGMSAAITNFLDNLRDLGTTYALIREPDPSPTLISTVFWLNAASGTVLAVLVAALGWPAALFFKEPALITVMQVLSLNFLFYGLNVVPTALLTRSMAFRTLAIANTTGAVAGTCVAITLALNGAGVWSLVAGSLMNTGSATAVSWLFCPWRPRLVFEWQQFRHIAQYSLNLSAFNLVNYFSRNADLVIIGRFLGPTQLGFYQMAYTLMMYPIANVSSIIAQVVFPAFAHVQHDAERIRAAFLRTCMLVSVVTFPTMLGLMVTSDVFVRTILGARWHPIIPILIIFAPLGMFQSVYTLVGVIYNAKGRSDWQLRWGLVSALFYVASFFVGLRWGILGVATSYSIAWLLLMVPGFEIPFRLIGLRQWTFWLALWPILRAAGIMAAIVAVLSYVLSAIAPGLPAVRLIVEVLAGLLCYVYILLRSRAPVINDIRTVLGKFSNPLVSWVLLRLPSVN